mgnify:CR=1 FL=1
MSSILVLPGDGIGPEYPESGEKLSLVATLYRARDFNDATSIASRLVRHQGAGHSVGIHTSKEDRAVDMGSKMPTCRVIVNQAHCFATGGSFDNGLPFSLSMGCGSWGGNSIDENFHHKHLLNITKIVRPIPVNEPSLDDVFDLKLLQRKKGSDKQQRIWDWSRQNGYLAIKEIMHLAELQGIQATPKGLRHGFAIACLDKGIPLNMVQKWMGHAHITTTAIYANALGREERKLAARLWD